MNIYKPQRFSEFNAKLRNVKSTLFFDKNLAKLCVKHSVTLRLNVFVLNF